MRLTKEQVKEALERSTSYSEAARRLKVSRQRLWAFCLRNGLSIEKDKAVAHLTPSDFKELRKRVGIVKKRKPGFYRK